MESRITIVEALLQTGPVVTAYLRAGRGPALMLLRDPSRHGASDPLLRLLAGTFKVTAPDLGFRARSAGKPEGPFLSSRSWLQAFMEGVGLERPAVVADAHLEAGLIHLLTTDARRVGRVALLVGASEAAAGFPPLPESSSIPGAREEAASGPVQVIRLPASSDGLPEPAARRRLSTFLGADGASPGATGDT
jgi:hypothetical protein